VQTKPCQLVALKIRANQTSAVTTTKCQFFVKQELRHLTQKTHCTRIHGVVHGIANRSGLKHMRLTDKPRMEQELASCQKYGPTRIPVSVAESKRTVRESVFSPSAGWRTEYLRTPTLYLPSEDSSIVWHA
jgi:hypothetical protein